MENSSALPRPETKSSVVRLQGVTILASSAPTIFTDLNHLCPHDRSFLTRNGAVKTSAGVPLFLIILALLTAMVSGS
jgi:hypothetical protein